MTGHRVMAEDRPQVSPEQMMGVLKGLPDVPAAPEKAIEVEKGKKKPVLPLTGEFAATVRALSEAEQLRKSIESHARRVDFGSEVKHPVGIAIRDEVTERYFANWNRIVDGEFDPAHKMTAAMFDHMGYIGDVTVGTQLTEDAPKAIGDTVDKIEKELEKAVKALGANADKMKKVEDAVKELADKLVSKEVRRVYVKFENHPSLRVYSMADLETLAKDVKGRLKDARKIQKKSADTAVVTETKMTKMATDIVDAVEDVDDKMTAQMEVIAGAMADANDDLLTAAGIVEATSKEVSAMVSQLQGGS